VSPSTATQGGSGHARVRSLDGMRAAAVVLVFAFHLGVPGFKAGFLGVDLFFVLSGFLITGLLLGEMERTGRIALPSFWARRVRRLMPALVVLLLAVAVVTALTATFSERTSIRGDLLATTTYVANWRFIDTSSYFVNTGVASPLQHTWSLAIEEQFYLMWPLLLGGLILLVKRPRRAVVVPALIGATASAALLAILWAPDAVDRAYMGTDARIFEPLIGALGAVLVASPRGRAVLKKIGTPLVAIGAIGLVACLAVIRPETAVYYYGGAVAVSVFALMMVAPLWVEKGGHMSRAFSWAPVAWLGAVSYGVYLWHWPVIQWLGVPGAHGAGAVVRGTLAVALTLGIAALSYYLIEQPILTGRGLGQHVGRHIGSLRSVRPVVVLSCVPVVMLLVAAASVEATSVPPPKAGQPVIMLVGDSVPLHLESTFEKEASGRGWRIVSAAQGACPVSGENPTGAEGVTLHEAKQCPFVVVPEQNSMIAAWHPNIVVWWDRWSVSDYVTADGTQITAGTPQFWRLRSAMLRSTVDRLTGQGARVVFVATEPPSVGILSRCVPVCARWPQFLLDHYADITTRWNGMMRVYAKQHPDQASFISVTDTMCRADVAPCDDTIDGVPARPDGIHYEGPAQKIVVGAIADRLARLLAHR
jgi:peptidoglycan/LPS O-acetylase OafA/YrhL